VSPFTVQYKSLHETSAVDSSTTLHDASYYTLVLLSSYTTLVVCFLGSFLRLGSSVLQTALMSHDIGLQLVVIP